VWVEDIDANALFQYVIDEGFNVEKKTDYYLITHKLLVKAKHLNPRVNLAERFPIEGSYPDYFSRLEDVVRFLGEYEMCKRYLSETMP
jgi:hypothetical protein